MAAPWKEIRPEDIKDNVFNLIGENWMLITAGTQSSWNTMTASWGTLGVLWEKQVAICFVRPTRHTFKFINAQEYFTLSFFSEQYRKALDFCGSHSGKDTDKAKATGLIPAELDGKAVTFEQARLVLLCRKLYTQDFDNSRFLDRDIESLYPQKDYHRLFIGEITRSLAVV
ncbi:MAG: flavin reductase family protein [Spirochaetales bacterium]|nr:MAG: flavin reductase family protein [Spirochaetales bacterium]